MQGVRPEVRSICMSVRGSPVRLCAFFRLRRTFETQRRWCLTSEDPTQIPHERKLVGTASLGRSASTAAQLQFAQGGKRNPYSRQACSAGGGSCGLDDVDQRAAAAIRQRNRV